MITYEEVQHYLTVVDNSDPPGWHVSGRTERAMYLARADGKKFANAVFRSYVPVRKVEADTIGYYDAPDKRRPSANGKTFVFTCAQNNTSLHKGFWDTLLKYVEYRKAELHVSRFVYNKNGMAANDAKGDDETDDDGVWYDHRIDPYVSDNSLNIGNDLVWCGELNIIPTRVHPLSTLKTYTRGKSGIVPHVKMRMDSVPTMKYDDPVFLYTTGTVTLRNYIQRQAGQVAEFHHVFGALVVEVADDGTWWARQINADKDGSFYDLFWKWTPSGPTGDPQRVAAITHGDIHIGKADNAILEAVFASGGILDMLKPHEQYFHDTIDFTPRNHHNIKDPHFMWHTHKDKSENVLAEFEDAANLLLWAHRPWCKSVVVLSNHDVAINHWLKNTAAFFDSENVGLWLETNLKVYHGGPLFSPFMWVLDKAISRVEDLSSGIMLDVDYVREDESRKVYGTDIEAGVHGHLGPNGARGSPTNLRTIGKANTAHTHSAGIIDGIYTAGVYGRLDMGYNKGPSSWSHSLVVTYLNGKRSILTLKNGKAWR